MIDTKTIKVGDIVVCLAKGWSFFNVGDILEVVQDKAIGDCTAITLDIIKTFPEDFELYEEPKLKKNIKAEDEVTLEVKTTYRDLASAYAVLGRTNGKDNCAIYLHIKGMIDAEGVASELINSHLKVIDYYSIQDEVESLLFPQETEHQKQIRELEETIEKAQKQIEELQKSS